MAQSSQNLRALFQRHLEQELAEFPSRDHEHRTAIANGIRKFAKTAERWIGNDKRGPWNRE